MLLQCYIIQIIRQSIKSSYVAFTINYRWSCQSHHLWDQSLKTKYFRIISWKPHLSLFRGKVQFLFPDSWNLNRVFKLNEMLRAEFLIQIKQTSSWVNPVLFNKQWKIFNGRRKKLLLLQYKIYFWFNSNLKVIWKKWLGVNIIPS